MPSGYPAFSRSKIIKKHLAGISLFFIGNHRKHLEATKQLSDQRKKTIPKNIGDRHEFF
jgi:hypothetical protein